MKSLLIGDLVCQKAIRKVIELWKQLRSFGTYIRNMAWADEKSLAEDIMVKCPGTARSHQGLGLYYMKNGNLDTALLLFEKSLSLLIFERCLVEGASILMEILVAKRNAFLIRYSSAPGSIFR